MEKAKIGDQRLKKKSRMPYVAAGLSLLFLVLGVSVMMAVIFNFKGQRIDEINAEKPYSLTLFAPSIQKDWFESDPIPADMRIKPEDRILAQGDEICVMFTTANSDPASASDTVYLTLSVDFREYPSSAYVKIARDEFYCVQPDLAKGYHSIYVKTGLNAAYGWSVRVD